MPVRIRLRRAAAAHNGIDEIAVPEDLAAARSRAPTAAAARSRDGVLAEGAAAAEVADDLVDLGGGQGRRGGAADDVRLLGRGVQQSLPQLAQVDLAAVVVVEGRQRRQQLGARRHQRQRRRDAVQEHG